MDYVIWMLVWVLFDMFTLYQEIMNDIAPAEIEDTNVTIKLANRDTITLLGIVRDVEVLCGKIKYPTNF